MQFRLTRQRRGIAALITLALVMSGLAVWHRGIPAAEVELNDGGVWVTNQALHLVGHLNYPSRTLDGAVRTGSGEFDVSQSANTVILHDGGVARAANINTADLTVSSGATVGGALSLTQGGSVVAAADSQTGKVWAFAADAVDSFRPENVPLIDGSIGVRVVVGIDGIAHAITPDGAVKKIVNGQVSDEGRIDGLQDLTKASLTAIGDRIAVLDPASSAVRTTTGSVPVDNAASLVLQLPGPANDRVLLAGPDSYVWAPAGGGTADVRPSGGGSGSPAAPAFLETCGYLAWSGSGAYVRDCANDADDQQQSVDKLKAFGQAEFRVNRDIIVLNDVDAGAVLLVNDNMRQIDNWKVANSATEKEDKETDSTEVTDEIQQTTKRQKNTKPVAQDDVYGARPGRSVTLPVLENDSDSDGDLLTASVASQPAGVSVVPVRGGEALSMPLPEDASGSMSFTYTADDGRSGTDSARVRVNVVPDSEENAPVQKRKPVITIAKQGEATYSLLGDFRDPESDSIYVSGADQPKGLSVRWRPDGVLTVKDLGTEGAGRKEIAVQVSDGTKTMQGTIYVQIRDGRLPPVANGDHVTVLKGETTVVSPLANDVDPMGGQLRLTTVAKATSGQTISPDYSNGTFSFTSTQTGTVYVAYQVANDSPKASTGYVRVDVKEPEKGKPVPGDDLAMLPDSGSVLVNVLANDTDPAGGVLVVKSVTVPEESGLAVETLQHNLLRVSAPTGLEGPTDFTYRVSNGPGEATGRVTVVPLPVTAATAPPIAVDDRAVVREGDVITVPVLNNDRSPSGLALSLDRKVTIEGEASAGNAFVSGDSVRFRAKKPGTVRLNYTVWDSAQMFTTAQVILTVSPLDQPNNPPIPQPVTGRALAGTTVTLHVPTDGIDPDGDSVTLLGVGSAPKLGTATLANGAIEYTVPADCPGGTDTFTYEVADRFGARATGTIRVGVAPPNATNQTPTAVPDDVTTRPGRILAINPIRNDVDPDGDALSLVDKSVTPADAGTSALVTIDGNLVELTTPEGDGALQYYYGVSDGFSDARGVVSIRVDKNAPLLPPVALDDVVTPAQVAGVSAVDVNVLDNDYDPDGSAKQLTVTSQDPGATVVDNHLSIAVTEERQVVLYKITDPDGGTAEATVVVPPSTGTLPYLDTAKMPLKVQAGELLTIPIRDFVIVRSGKQASLTFAAKVEAGTGSDPSQESVKDVTTLQFRSTPDFVGMSSVTFEVTDGASADDPDGLTATLSLPIEVTPSPNAKHQPVFTPSDVTVAAGDGPKTIDLAQLASDVDPGDKARLTFSTGAVSGRVAANLNGSKLELTAPPDLAPGSTGSVTVTVTDGSTAPVSGQLLIKVTASTRPLIAVRTATIADAKAGAPSTIDLSSYLTNPFAQEGQPITIVGTPTVSPAAATVSVSGLTMTITPQAGFHGPLVVTYLAQDATKQISRQVRGNVKVTVRDRPDPPTAVSAETNLSHTATVSWTAGANNGAPITDFTVHWTDADSSGTGSKACGQVTTCLISGLTNAHNYTFTVVATNEVGESDPSSPSNSVKPDVKPDPPGTPVGVFGDQRVAVSWAAANSDGSPVTGYTVEISPAVGGTTQQNVTGTTMTWVGLSNGTAYTFRVRATSDFKDPSDWSGSSAAIVPAGPPFRPNAPSVNKDPVSTLAPAATVSWTAPDGNGDSNLTYEMRQSGSGSVLYTGTGTSAHVTMSVSTSDQTFEVRAKNKAGWSTWSSASAGVRAFKTPGSVSSLSVTPTGTNNQVKISFGAAAGNGALASEMTYYWSANGVTQSVASGGGTVTNASAFPNGQDVNVAVYAVSKVNGETSQGSSTTDSVNAYGPPVSPSISCSGGDRSITCNWSGGSANGRTTTYTLSDGMSGTVGASGSKTVGGLGYSQSVRVCIKATQSTGLSDGANCDSATTDPAPPDPSVTLSKGASVYETNTPPGACTTASCAWVVVKTADFSSNVSCTMYWPNGSTAGSWTQGPNETRRSNYYFGYPGNTITVRCGGVTGTIRW